MHVIGHGQMQASGRGSIAILFSSEPRRALELHQHSFPSPTGKTRGRVAFQVVPVLSLDQHALKRDVSEL
jgi:hypothetical protein